MKTSFNKQQLSLAVACALVMGFASGAARAQTPDQSRAELADRALVTSSSGSVWRNGFGECWTSSGPAPLPGAECYPRPVAQYVAPAPYVAPYVAPVVVAAAPLPIYDKVILDANVLFDFDKSVLRPAGRDTLDSFVNSIQGMNSRTITAIGHADRIGTDGYNQTLSESRVATVKAYLVSKGIESTWVQSSGQGEMAPTTAAGTCTGAGSASTIACLQPDRHVFIEMSGSRLRQ